MEDPNEKNKKPNDILPKNDVCDPETGLDKWNQRLDENLEPEGHNDELADENAKNFSEQFESDGEVDSSE